MRESKLCHTSPVDGEITLRYGNGYKMFLVFSLKITTRNLYALDALDMSALLYCINGGNVYIIVTLIGRSC